VPARVTKIRGLPLLFNEELSSTGELIADK